MNWLLCLSRRAEVKILAGTSMAYALLLWLLPALALAVAAAGLVMTILLVSGRIACAWRSRPKAADLSELTNDFVSIQVATYSEPPEVVCRTLDSLASLDYPHYEVIVLDNNTPDQNLYLPVQEHCRKLGPKFRFYHFDGVQGAKAGALNLSLDLADSRTEFILVLDADYQAKPNILSSGLPHFSRSEVALVQFPQAYRNSHDGCGLTWEYRLFFDVYMNLANHWNTVLSTGTVSFVRRDALEKSGGWSGETLTEDAELGLRLHRHGYRGVYVPEVMAAGVMPTDLDSLKAQRRRWVLGNAQSLAGLFAEEGLSVPRKLLMALQLTAWASPLLLPLVTLAVGGLAYKVNPEQASSVVGLSTSAIGAYLGGMLVFFAVALQRQGQKLSTALKAYLVHLGMLWEASVCWCELFVQSDKSFVRTDKFLRAPQWFPLTATLIGAVLLGAAGLHVAWNGGSPWLALACTTTSALASGRAFLCWNLHQVRRRTAGLEKWEVQGRSLPRGSLHPGLARSLRVKGRGAVPLRGPGGSRVSQATASGQPAKSEGHKERNVTPGKTT